MKRKVGMVHAVATHVRLFNELVSEILPGVDVVHFVDEGLPFLAGEQSRERVVRRLGLLASFAEESDAEVVLLTCTAFGRLVDEVEAAVNIPVLSVLEIIIDQAMELGDRIGVLGTHPGTVESAARLIREQATRHGKKVEVTARLCAGAFEALRREDWATHDGTVLKHLKEIMEAVQVVVIPQPSIERVLNQVPESGRPVPILTSSRLAVERLKEKLG